MSFPTKSFLWLFLQPKSLFSLSLISCRSWSIPVVHIVGAYGGLFKILIPTLYARTRFLKLSTMDILDCIVFWCFFGGRGGCPLHCTMFSSVPGLYPINASTQPNPLSLDIIKCPLGGRGAKSPPTSNENHWSRPWSSMALKLLSKRLLRNFR